MNQSSPPEPDKDATETFIDVVAHDLGAPLRAVTQFSFLLQESCHGRLSEDETLYLRLVVEGGQKLQTMLSSLLDYARLPFKADPSQKIDWPSLVAAWETGHQEILHDTKAEISCAPCPILRGDPALASIACNALLDNALKFRSPERALRIAITAQSTPEGLLLSLTDNGIGIKENAGERIFRPFQKLHLPEDYPGNGMGLTFVRRIMEIHQGKAWAEPAHPFGTTIHLLWPT